MLNCKQATHLMSEGQDRPLRPGERLSLGLHLGMCRGCRTFRQQMAFLRAACRSLRQQLSTDDTPADPR